jgi:hypothetical protein
MDPDYVSRWLMEKKPQAKVRYFGPDPNGVHGWRLEFPDTTAAFELWIPEELLGNAGMLAERLMELETAGHLDLAGEEDWIVHLTPVEVAREPGIWE